MSFGPFFVHFYCPPPVPSNCQFCQGPKPFGRLNPFWFPKMVKNIYFGIFQPTSAASSNFPSFERSHRSKYPSFSTSSSCEYLANWGSSIFRKSSIWHCSESLIGRHQFCWANAIIANLFEDSDFGIDFVAIDSICCLFCSAKMLAEWIFGIFGGLKEGIFKDHQSIFGWQEWIIWILPSALGQCGQMFTRPRTNENGEIDGKNGWANGNKGGMTDPLQCCPSRLPSLTDCIPPTKMWDRVERMMKAGENGEWKGHKSNIYKMKK